VSLEELVRRLPPVRYAAEDDPVPPPDLLPESFAERMYVALAPLAQSDPEQAWSLLTYMNAIGVMFQLLDDLLRDSPEGPGWSSLMDLNRCPPEALPWLGQFVGVRMPASYTPDQQRARIVATDGWKRGTVDAIKGAASATLTGNKTVFLHERAYNDAYRLQVTTYDSQTPDPSATQAAIVSQKPAGIVLDYQHVRGQTYQQVRDRFASYQLVKTTYASYDAVRNDTPA
jgi:hypothetical protein